MKIEDLYIALTSSERIKNIEVFINKYLKGHKEEAEYYEYPPFLGKTEFETANFKDMLAYVLEGSNRWYHFYFENTDNEECPKGMIFINKDGSVFLGLGVFTSYTSKYINALKQDFQSSLILICNNTLPPDNIDDFKSLV